MSWPAQIFNSLLHPSKGPLQPPFGFMSISLTVLEEIATQNFAKSRYIALSEARARAREVTSPNFLIAYYTLLRVLYNLLLVSCQYL